MQKILEDKNFISFTVLAALFLYLFRLDNYYLGLDLADYPLHALSILEFGVPYILGNSPPLFNVDFSMDGLWTYHPWLGMYLIAISILLFGQTTFAAVLPTALCGVAAILVIYRLAFYYDSSRGTARLATLFFLLSPSCILYMRTSRYLGVQLILSLLATIFFLQLVNNSKKKIYPFCIVSILLFYGMYAQFFESFFGFGVYALIFIREKELIKKLIKSCGVIGAFTFPFFYFLLLPTKTKVPKIYSVYLDEPYTKSIDVIFEFLVQYLAALNTQVFPITIIGIFLFFKFKFKIKFSFTKEKIFFYILASSIIGLAVLHTGTPLHRLLGAIPIFFIILANICNGIFQKSRKTAGMLVYIMIITNWLHIAPWFIIDRIMVPVSLSIGMPIKSPKRPLISRWVATIHDTNFSYSYLLGFFLELSTDYNGPLKGIVEYLKKHAKPGDTFMASHEGDSIHYYTGLRWSNEIPITTPPDWIIPRGKRKHFNPSDKIIPWKEARKSIEYVANYIKTHPYKKIVLSMGDEGYENSYNLPNHQFFNKNFTNKVTLYKYEGEK